MVCGAGFLRAARRVSDRNVARLNLGAWGGFEACFVGFKGIGFDTFKPNLARCYRARNAIPMKTRATLSIAATSRRKRCACGRCDVYRFGELRRMAGATQSERRIEAAASNPFTRATAFPTSSTVVNAPLCRASQSSGHAVSGARDIS